MAFLLDSDIVIRYLSGHLPTKALVDPLRAPGISISVISYIEVVHGILIAPDPSAAMHGFEEWLEDVPVFEISRRIAFRCALIRVDLARNDRRFRNRSLDLIVAATALEYGLSLVTRNTPDYRDIPGLSLAL